MVGTKKATHKKLTRDLRALEFKTIKEIDNELKFIVNNTFIIEEGVILSTNRVVTKFNSRHVFYKNADTQLLNTLHATDLILLLNILEN
jgi:hypothetical protein